MTASFQPGKDLLEYATYRHDRILASRAYYGFQVCFWREPLVATNIYFWFAFCWWENAAFCRLSLSGFFVGDVVSLCLTCLILSSANKLAFSTFCFIGNIMVTTRTNISSQLSGNRGSFSCPTPPCYARVLHRLILSLTMPFFSPFSSACCNEQPCTSPSAIADWWPY